MICSIGQLINIDNRIMSMINDISNEGGTDEAGTTGDEDIHMIINT